MAGGGDDFSSPYQPTYSWTASSAAAGAQTVTAHNNSGLSSTGSFTVSADTTPPSGQTIDNDGGPYYTTLSVPLTLNDGSDVGSGVDAASGIVERQSAALSNDSCVSWSGWSAVGLVGNADTSVASGTCYRYRYSVSDNVGNLSSPSPASGIAKVAPPAPASPIACDGAACSAGWYTSAVSVSLSASDAASGVQQIRYTTDGTDPSPLNGTVYSAPFGVAATTTVRFRAYDRVGNEEAVGSRLVRVDTSAPAAPTLSYGSFQNAVLAGGAVWYRPNAATGQFAVTASSSDGESG